MSKLFLFGVIVVSLGGCATRAGMSYDRQEPLPTDLSSVKYLYGLVQDNGLVQIATISPSLLAQRARPNIKEYVEEDKTEYDDEEYDDEDEE